MEGGGRSDASSTSSKCSVRSVYPGDLSQPTEFIREIELRCNTLCQAYRNRKDAEKRLKEFELRQNLPSYIMNESDRQSWIEEFKIRISTCEGKLKNSKPWIKRNCRVHSWDKNLCAHIKHLQTRIQQQQTIAITFIDTLKQMRENNLDNTTQYLDDYAKLKEIQADIDNIDGELGPCPVMNCDKHTPEIEDQPAQMDIEIEQPFQPIDKRHAAKRKTSTSTDNPDIATYNKFQILEDTAQPRKDIPPIHLKLTEV
ncbi:hypothetical protein HNY73_000100 [Argiope bruennichi]|uniref:Uncharacterized protein n=1 Tax=Argiope bruennichi TaxID=94029 RepID=A0A8T0FZD0_ARGBR|nr:hypothetical protein HNY73_000100 [Argiope bruennichi]